MTPATPRVCPRCSVAGEARVRTIGDGSRPIYSQCPQCGSALGAVSKQGLEVEHLPVFNEALKLSGEQARSADFEFQRELRQHEWQTRYESYLRSPEWSARRALVLKRDGYVCQGCLKRGADEVHHLTYRHLGYEPLFELVSVCNECHRSISEPIP